MNIINERAGMPGSDLAKDQDSAAIDAPYKNQKAKTFLDVSPAGQAAVVWWLFAVAAMVFAMVVLGGVTRLTNSGLSMADWRPVTGWLPPLTEAAWMQVFELYRTTPEYQQINAGMSLDDFKGIFWLEYLHRLWGRIIGIAFAVPFVVFLIKGYLPGLLKWQCLGLLFLGGMQGVLGWFMVQSGLVDEPAVSQYRLAAHLGLALVIFMLLVGLGLGLRDKGRTAVGIGLRPGTARGFLVLAFLTVLSGAFVAGLDAGMIYNTFPLMDGALVPAGLFPLDPWYKSAFEDHMTVQFDHRVLAMTTVFVAWGLFAMERRRISRPGARKAVTLLVGVVTLQATLGIATLLAVVPVSLAALHQAGAVILLGTAVWCVHESRTVLQSG